MNGTAKTTTATINKYHMILRLHALEILHNKPLLNMFSTNGPTSSISICKILGQFSSYVRHYYSMDINSSFLLSNICTLLLFRYCC